MIETNNMGGGGTTADRGEYQEFGCLDTSVTLENEMFSKYPDSAAANYKTLTKRMIQSLKSNSD